MDLTAYLNPAPWRDEDRRCRVAAPQPPSGIGAALCASFEPGPLSPDLAALLAKLR